MDQRVPWNQFTREDRKLRWAIAGVPYVTVVGYAGGLAIKNAPAPLGTQPKAAFSAAGIRVYRSAQETGVILWTRLCRRDVPTFV
jgi:hypothetical protein